MNKGKDHTGLRYGKLLVVKRMPNDHRRDTIWLCKCDCGNEINVLAGNFKRTNSCGCIATENRKHKDIIGLRKGKLTVIEEMDSISKRGSSYRIVLCRCDCGNLITKRLTAMFYENDRSGDSCGCLRVDTIKNRPKPIGYEARRKPNRKKTDLYTVWSAMKDRCYAKSNKSYHRYGGRGIIICDEWKNNYIVFHDWAINNGYKKGLSIDRKDNNKNYEPSNCRFTTPLIQANNKENTVYVYFKGERIAISLVCRELGLRTATIRQRMFRDGHTFDEAISMSLKKVS